MATDSSKSLSGKPPVEADAPVRTSSEETETTRDPTSPESDGPAEAGSDAGQGPSEADDARRSEDATDPPERFWRRRNFLLLTALPSWLTSMVVHIIGLLILALISIPLDQGPQYNELTIGEATEPADDLTPEELIPPLDVPAPAQDDSQLMPEVDTEVIADEPVLSLANDLDASPLQIQFDPLGDEGVPPSDLLSKVGVIGGTGLEGRGTAARADLVRKGGGTKASEASVALALKWFAAHQDSDGGWDLDHRMGTCQSRCRNPGGRHNARNGATALALLPYLGAGQTHIDGEYKEVVRAGLEYLLRGFKSGARVAGQRFSLYDQGGNYYSHGLGAIVLCESYAMTKDKSLVKPAQMAIFETAYAQDPVGGGWRYQPHQRGDTSAVGWQLMALKSAHMAYLNVPAQTYIGASKFLDSVQADSGSKYGYLDPGRSSATSAVGLLCRMYLGWDRDNPALERGVQWMKVKGPSESNMYYNYYATQVMRHYGGDPWKVWNVAMREYLVRSQSQIGHEKGSWYFQGGGHAGLAGGRLYATSMATMILEVYYRHLPIYKKQASEEDFPL